MKKMTLIFGMIISVALLFTSCTKAVVDDIVTDPAPNGTGSYSMTIDGNTFTTLQDELNMALGIVAFAGTDYNGVDFVITMANIPSIGNTETFCIEGCGEDVFTFLYMGDDGVAYVLNEGTITRTTEKKIEMSGKLMGFDEELHDFSLTINLNIIVG